MTYPQQQFQPQFPQYPPQQFAPQPMPQGFPQPPQPPAAPELAKGSLDEFYQQPSTAGGPGLKFPSINTTHVGIVARAVTSGDVQQQTNTQGVPQTYKDGRPKFQMRVPLTVQPSEQHPQGEAVWYVKGPARDELVRAMAEAGAPAGPPEAGAAISVTFIGERQNSAGFNATKLFRVVYQRPAGATNTAPPAPEPQQPSAPQPEPAPAPQPQQPPAPEPAPAPQPSAPEPPAGLSAEQQQLLAKLTGK